MAQYWPENVEDGITVGPFTITLLAEEEYDEVCCRKLELRSSSSKVQLPSESNLESLYLLAH